MSAWKLLPDEGVDNDDAFAVIDELFVTAGAFGFLGEADVVSAVRTLLNAAFTRHLDDFQVLERTDGEHIFAVDEDGRVTLMLPEDW